MPAIDQPLNFDQPLEEWLDTVRDIPCAEWIVDGLIPADTVTIISGRPKLSKKTLLAFQIVRAVATGQRISGGLQGTKPLRCLIIEAEGAKKETMRRWHLLTQGSLQQLAEQLGHEQIDALTQAEKACVKIPPKTVYFYHRLPFVLTDEAHVAAVLDFIRAKEISLLVIDPLAQAMRGDENSSEDVAKVNAALNRLRQTGCAVIYIHHIRKPDRFVKDDVEPPDIDDDVRGSSALTGAYDVHFALRNAGAQGYLVVRQKDAEERFFHMNWRLPTKEEPLRPITLDMMECNVADEKFLAYSVERLITECERQNKLDFTLTELSKMCGLPLGRAADLREALVRTGKLVFTKKGGQRCRLIDDLNPVAGGGFTEDENGNLVSEELQ